MLHLHILGLQRSQQHRSFFSSRMVRKKSSKARLVVLNLRSNCCCRFGLQTVNTPNWCFKKSSFSVGNWWILKQELRQNMTKKKSGETGDRKYTKNSKGVLKCHLNWIAWLPNMSSSLAKTKIPWQKVMGESIRRLCLSSSLCLFPGRHSEKGTVKHQSQRDYQIRSEVRFRSFCDILFSSVVSKKLFSESTSVLWFDLGPHQVHITRCDDF